MAATFLTVNTGQGANELYDMDQNVLMASSVTFDDVLVSDELTVDSEAITNWDDLSAYIDLGDEGGSGFSLGAYTYLLTINDTYVGGPGVQLYLVYNQTSDLVFSDTNFTKIMEWCAGNASLIGGGLVHIKAGDYPFDGHMQLLNVSNVMFQGEGTATKLIPMDMPSILIGDEADTSPSYNITFCDMAFNCTNLDTAIQDGTWSVIRIEDSSGGMTVRDTSWWGGTLFSHIYGHQCTGPVLVTDNFFKNCYASGGIIHPHEGSDWIITDNHIVGGGGEAIRHGRIIANNKIEGFSSVGQDAIIVTGDSPALCSGNHIDGGSGDGIEAWGDYSIISDNIIMDLANGRGIYTWGVQNDIIISNNYIYRASLAGIETTSGDQRITIQGNYFFECYSEGILCKSDDSVIVNNFFHRQGHLSEDLEDVIVLDGADRCLVSNNKMEHSNGANGPRTGVWVSDSDNCTITNNQIDNTLSAGVNVTKSDGALILGNHINTNMPQGGYSIYLGAKANYSLVNDNYCHLGVIVIGGTAINNTLTNNMILGDITDTGTGTRAWENINPWAGVFITTINGP